MDIRQLWRQFSDAITSTTGKSNVDDSDIAIVRAMSPSGVIFEASAGQIERDRSMSDLYWAIDNIFWMAERDDFDGYHYLRDVYVGNDNNMFVITVSDGKLFQFPVSLDSTDEVELGEPQQVQLQFAPVEQRSMTVTRGDDGIYRALAVLSTAVLNKSGEIDSTDLYDSFEADFEGVERVNFHHTEIEFGTLRMIRRSNYVLWGVLEFDDTEIGRAAAETIATDEDGEWGISIEFNYNPDAVDFIDVSGIPVPVYNDGKLTRASVLKSRKAAAWFTAIPSTGIIERTRTVNKSVKDDLGQLVGEDLVEEAAQLDTEINSRAVDEDMIRREDESPPTGQIEESASESPSQTPEADGAEVIEVDETLMAVVIDGVANSDAFSSLQDTIGAFQAQLNEAIANIADVVTANNELNAELREMKERQGQFESGYDEAVAEFSAASPKSKRTYTLKGNTAVTAPPANTDTNSLLANRMKQTKVGA